MITATDGYDLPGSQLTAEKIRHQRPGLIRKAGIVTIAIRHSEAVAGAVKVMPIQWLAAGLKARHQFLLHRNARDMVLAAEKNLRRTFEIFHRLVGMARSQFVRFLVAHRRIVADEGADTGGRRRKVDTDAAAHAVADHGATFGVDFGAGRQIAPSAVEYLDKLSVGGGLLRFMHAVSDAEHFI